MQYNKQLFTADLLDLRLNLSAFLALKLAYTLRLYRLSVSLLAVFLGCNKAVIKK